MQEIDKLNFYNKKELNKSGLNVLISLFSDIKNNTKNKIIKNEIEDIIKKISKLKLKLKNNQTIKLDLTDRIKKLKLLNKDSEKQLGATGDPFDDENCFAKYVPIELINTDPYRFQNRTDAFSEISANAVAENFDPNKFDPIVLWKDPTNEKFFVLSGHSRLEGMKRRNEKQVPSKLFEGTESEAIQFARVDANRLTTSETLSEDIKAYRLMKLGDESKNIKPKNKKEIAATFKGKQPRQLEALSYLNEKGLFIEWLSDPELSAEIKGLKRIAQVVGNFKKDMKEKGKEVTNIQENNIFDFIVNYPKATQINDIDLMDLLIERFSAGKEYLFNCTTDDCPDELMSLEKFTESTKRAILLKELNKLEKEKDYILQRFNTDNQLQKIHTEQEKDVYRGLFDELDKRTKHIRKEIDMPERQKSFFGIENNDNVTDIITILKNAGYEAFEIVPNSNNILNLNSNSQ